MELPAFSFPFDLSINFSTMHFPWAILISLVVVGFAYLLDHFFAEIIEEEHKYMHLVYAFFAMYAIAAVAIYWLNPSLPPRLNEPSTLVVEDS